MSDNTDYFSIPTHVTTPDAPDDAWVQEKSIITGWISPGNLMFSIPGHGRRILFEHNHYDLALRRLRDFHVPIHESDFRAHHHYGDWPIVAELTLQLVRLRLLEPNSFQKFMLNIFIMEYQPECCPECGLIWSEDWCGMSYTIILSLSFTNIFL